MSLFGPPEFDEEEKEKLRKLAATTIQLKKRFFEKFAENLEKDGVPKSVHFDNHRRGIEKGDIVRFTNGYDPANGEVFRKIFNWYKENKYDILYVDLEYAGITNLEWFSDFVEGSAVYRFSLKQIDKHELTEALSSE